MKVCILTSVHTPLDTRIFYKEARALAAAGHDVVIMAPADERIVAEGIEILPLFRARNRLRRMLRAFLMYRAAASRAADVYHFHDPELLVVGALLALARKVPVVYDVHEHYPSAIMAKPWIPGALRKPVRWAFDVVERLLVPVVGNVVYTTPLVGKRYESMRCKAVRVENYPPSDLFLTETFEMSEARASRILYLGGMSPGRGIRELIRAFQMVAEKHPRAQFDLIGPVRPAPFSIELQQMIQETGLGTRLRYRPPVSLQEAAELVRDYGIGLVTYLPEPNNVMCLPNKLFEYMAAGLAVIGSDFPLYREVLVGRDAGLVVNPSSPEELAEALDQLLADPARVRAMGENGRRAIAEDLNWEKEAENLLSLYRGFEAALQHRLSERPISSGVRQ